MDIRIVNTCNNSCLYCLESSLRKKEAYIDVKEIYNQIIQKPVEGKGLNFYGGNALLHPDLRKIISFGKDHGYMKISLLTNGYSITQGYLKELITFGLTGIGIYFHCFDKKKHQTVVGNNSVSLKKLLGNIGILQEHGMLSKVIIHVNGLNIESLYQDMYLLYKKYGVRKFEYVNYFPFDTAYTHINVMGYDIQSVRTQIDKLFLIIQKLGVTVDFLKFPKVFFGESQEFYNYKRGIEEQIGDEDKERLDHVVLGKEMPFCYKEKRCDYCFIQDNCRFYGL